MVERAARGQIESYVFSMAKSELKRVKIPILLPSLSKATPSSSGIFGSSVERFCMRCTQPTALVRGRVNLTTLNRAPKGSDLRLFDDLVSDEVNSRYVFLKAVLVSLLA